MYKAKNKGTIVQSGDIGAFERNYPAPKHIIYVVGYSRCNLYITKFYRTRENTLFSKI